MKKVCGIGVNDTGIKQRDMLKCYNVWKSMLNRCYSGRTQDKQPTYKGCSICEEWLYLSNYKAWYDEHYVEGFQVDKDILVRGNKIYSPDTCRFVPQNINSLLIGHGVRRSKYGMGVHVKGSGYQVLCAVNGKLKYFGTYKTVEEAQSVSKKVKEQTIKETAQTAYDNGQITEEIYNALMVWEV